MITQKIERCRTTAIVAIVASRGVIYGLSARAFGVVGTASAIMKVENYEDDDYNKA